MWDVMASGEELKNLAGHTNSVNSVAFSANGSRIVSGSGRYVIGEWDPTGGKNMIWVWDATSGEEPKSLAGHTTIVWSVAFSADGSCIVSGSGDNTIRVWDATDGEVCYLICVTRFTRPMQMTSCKDLSPPWILTDPGWIVKRYHPQDRLAIVPFPQHVVFDPHSTKLIISLDGSVSVDLSRCMLGPGWEACYTRS
jgi:hypothetical protein